MPSTYRVGPSDFFTSGDLSADAQTVQSQVQILDSQLTGNELVPVDFADQWTSFERQWGAFYADHFSGFFSTLLTAFNDANRDDLIRYESQLAAFQERAAAFGAQNYAPVGPSSGAKDNIGAQLAAQGLPSTTSILLIAAALVAVIVVLKK